MTPGLIIAARFAAGASPVTGKGVMGLFDGAGDDTGHARGNAPGSLVHPIDRAAA